jgi:hypothetical protein
MRVCVRASVVAASHQNAPATRAESWRAFRQEIEEWCSLETNPYPDGDEGQPRDKKEDVDGVPRWL